jgi:hypothetical protein
MRTYGLSPKHVSHNMGIIVDESMSPMGEFAQIETRSGQCCYRYYYFTTRIIIDDDSETACAANLNSECRLAGDS